MNPFDDPAVLDHPEVNDIFGEVMVILGNESDRGAVLVGAALVDEHLARLFGARFHQSVSRGQKRGLLEGTGPLSTFSARNMLAFALGFIPKELYDSINCLRRLRNDVAHSPKAFRLEDHKTRIEQICAFGDGLHSFVIDEAGGIVRSVAITLLLRQEAVGPSGIGMKFANEVEVAKTLDESEEALRALGKRSARWGLGLALGFICMTLVASRHPASPKSL